MDSETQSNVVINLSDNDAGEAIISASTLTFTVSDWSAAQTVMVTGVDENFADSSQIVLITVSEDNLSDTNSAAIDNKTVNSTNTDAGEALGFTITETNSSTCVTESGATDNLSITLNSEPLADLILNIVSADTWGSRGLSKLSYLHN